MRKLFAIAAICSTTLSPIMGTAALASTTAVPVAVGANAATQATMASQCAALAAAEPTQTGSIAGTAPDGRPYTQTWSTSWSSEVVLGGSLLVSGPNETGARTIDPNSIVGTGSFTWGGVKIVGDPGRIGGSVNMFGNQRATEKNFSSSTYDYTADFTSTFAYASSCTLTETTHYDAVHLDSTPDIPGHPVQGYYTNPSEPNGGGEGSGVEHGNGGQSCSGFTPANDFWGLDHGACIFTKTADAVDPVEGYDAFDIAASDAVTATKSVDGAPVNQDQIDNFLGHEANGGPVTLSGDLFVGNPVICISPKKLPGIWTKQNGYTGDKCTTAWFNVAPWLAGTDDSNGTYISVPAY